MANAEESSTQRDGGLKEFVNSIAVLAIVVGWLWAIGMMFIPVNSGDECGVPAIFDKAAYVQAQKAEDDPDLSSDNDYERFAEDCEASVNSRIGGAVGISVITVPISVLWLGLWLRRTRQSSENA